MIYALVQLLGAVAAITGAYLLWGLAWSLLGVGLLLLFGSTIAEALGSRPAAPPAPRRTRQED